MFIKKHPQLCEIFESFGDCQTIAKQEPKKLLETLKSKFQHLLDEAKTKLSTEPTSGNLETIDYQQRELKSFCDKFLRQTEDMKSFHLPWSTEDKIKWKEIQDKMTELGISLLDNSMEITSEIDKALISSQDKEILTGKDILINLYFAHGPLPEEGPWLVNAASMVKILLTLTSI